MDIFKKEKSNIHRLNEILKVLSKYEFGYVIDKIGLKRNIPFIKPSYPYKSMEELDNTIPTRLRMVFQELGPTFIKLGQTISTRPDLVGYPLASELSKLQYDNPPIDFQEIKHFIEKELGDKVENIFESINPKPLATASIGQVHKAKIINNNVQIIDVESINGKEVNHEQKIKFETVDVIIKVQKPGLEELINEDLAIIKFLVKRIDEYIPQFKTYNLQGIVEEFERSILKEIDYTQELENQIRFKNNFKDDSAIYAPITYNDFSTKKVLTMEYIDGVKISEVDSKHYDKKLIAKRGIESYFKQIMTYGFFHADPHPSNLYILKNNIICYIDFGMMGILDEEFKENLIELFIYFIENNVQGMLNQLIYMEIIDEHVDLKNLKYDFIDFMNRYYGVELKGIHGGMKDLINIMGKYNVRLPREFVLIARGIGMLEETGIDLDPDFNAVEILKPFTIKTAKKRVSPSNLLKKLKNNVFEIEHLIKTIPINISRTLYKLEKGTLGIEIEHKNLEKITNRISFSLIVSALIIGSSLVMMTDKGIMILGFPFLGIIGFIISFILGIWLVLSMLKGKNY